MSTDPKELAKMVSYRFTVHAGQRIVGGKSYYPNMLRLRLDNRYAVYQLAQELLKHIGEPRWLMVWGHT